MKDYDLFIEGERALDAYFYLRNGLLHCRYTRDVCINLYDTEEAQIKNALDIGKLSCVSENQRKRAKQNVLQNAFFCLAKDRAVKDGVGEMLKGKNNLTPVDKDYNI